MIRTLILLAALAQQPAPAPKLWQLRDINGQAWQHADLDFLSRWVDWYNAQLATQARTRSQPARQPFVYYQTPSARYFQAFSGYSSCPGGACPR